MYTADSAGGGPRTAPRRGGVYGHSSRTGVRRLGAGIGIAVALLVLGFLAKTGPVTSLDVSIDRAASATRNPLFTALAKLLTLVMEPEVWAVLGVIGAVVLFLVRRRGQALRVICVMICSIGVTFVAKTLVDEHRPPKSLWVLAPDSEGSYPSGHTTAAAAVAVCVFLLVPVARRQLFAIIGAVFVAVVALARVYLGVHYILDTLGAVLATGCAVVFLSGLALLPPGRRWLLALDGAGRPRGDRPAGPPPDHGYGTGFFGDEPGGDARPGHGPGAAAGGAPFGADPARVEGRGGGFFGDEPEPSGYDGSSRRQPAGHPEPVPGHAGPGATPSYGQPPSGYTEPGAPPRPARGQPPSSYADLGATPSYGQAPSGCVGPGPTPRSAPGRSGSGYAEPGAAPHTAPRHAEPGGPRHGSDEPAGGYGAAPPVSERRRGDDAPRGNVYGSGDPRRRGTE